MFPLLYMWLVMCACRALADTGRGQSHIYLHACGEDSKQNSGSMRACCAESGKPVAEGLQSIYVDKLQNRAWSQGSLPGLAFLEEAAAAYQERQEQRSGASKLDNQPRQGSAQAADSHGSAVERDVEVRAIWERDAWLRKGQRKVVMRMNTVKTVPVSLDVYLSNELRACARKCAAC